MLPCQSIVLVTPVWNDSKRLASFAPELGAAIHNSDLPILWVIADDGSNALEQSKYELTANYVRSLGCKIETVRLEERSYKGEAIYNAWDNYRQADWLAFVDADGAVCAKSIIELIHLAAEKGKDASAIAIRSASEKSVRRAFKRRCSFYFFILLVRLIVGLKLGDTQCGAKVISGRAYRKFAPQLTERGFVFDVELLVLLKMYQVPLMQCPVQWEEKAKGKINVLRDGWLMLIGLLRIRRRLQTGAYNPIKS